MNPKIKYGIEQYTILVYKIKDMECLNREHANNLAALLGVLEWDSSVEECLEVVKNITYNLSFNDIGQRIIDFCNQLKNDNIKKKIFLLNLSLMSGYLYYCCKDLQRDHRNFLFSIFKFFGLSHTDLLSYEKEAGARFETLFNLILPN